MILSDVSILSRLITDDIEKFKKLWIERQWEEIKGRILIHPFNQDHLDLNCYNLCVGDQYISLRDPDEIREIKDKIVIEPGETVLILTQEFVALPKNIFGFVVPRARLIFEGIIINSTKIDPTWYGKLLVAVTNITKYPLKLYKGKPFCSVYFEECEEVKSELNKDKVPSLGREEILSEDVTRAHIKFEPLLEVEKVTKKDMERVVEVYGKPWDIIRGMFELSKDDILKYIEKEIQPNLIEEAKKEAYKDAYEKLIKFQTILIMAVVVAIIGALIKFLFFL